MRHLTQMDENLHTVRIHDLIYSQDLKDIFIVMNYMDSDLRKVLLQDNIGFNEKHTITILFRLLCAIDFLHKANVMHRDLKPGNILLDQDCRLLLCDFGLARTSRKVEQKKKDYTREAMTEKLLKVRPNRQIEKRSLSNHVMSRSYRSPEIIILETKYRNSVDTWSVGCILAELIL